MRKFLVLLLFVLMGTSVVALPEAQAATKQSRVPWFITDAGAYTGNFRESANFTVRWGDAVDVVYDYTDGARIRSDVWWNGGNYRPAYTVSLGTVNQANGDYRVPAAKAPQQYGYNLIQLNPVSSGGQVSVRLTGQVNPNLGSDWRFGLVAVRPDFSVRYSPQFGPNQTATFHLQPGETRLMLAVAATPSVHVNYAEGATVGAFPYQFNIRGATPAAGNT